MNPYQTRHMNAILRFIKTWTLPIAMACGAAAYVAGARLPFTAGQRSLRLAAVAAVQPILIFAMLFITFCKVNPHDLKLRRWHGWLLLIQGGAFALLSLLLIARPDLPGRVVAEGAMLCLICPTATAGAVVTAKLGGDAAGLTTYTILINIVAAVAVPLFVPLVHPHPGLDFLTSFFMIMGKVFPMLICPFFAAMLVRWLFPRVLAAVAARRNLAFNIWAVSLALAIAVTARSIAHSSVALAWQAGIAAASLVCCVAQFALGRLLGRRYGCPVSAGQSLGQKNTVFAIWMGYTFLTPVSAIAGGFYSIWHNMYNSWKLYSKSQAMPPEDSAEVARIGRKA